MLWNRHCCVSVIAVAKFPPVSLKSLDPSSYCAISNFSPKSAQLLAIRFSEEYDGNHYHSGDCLQLHGKCVVTFVCMFVFSWIDLFERQH